MKFCKHGYKINRFQRLNMQCNSINFKAHLKRSYDYIFHAYVKHKFFSGKRLEVNLSLLNIVVRCI